MGHVADFDTDDKLLLRDACHWVKVSSTLTNEPRLLCTGNYSAAAATVQSAYMCGDHIRLAWVAKDLNSTNTFNVCIHLQKQWMIKGVWFYSVDDKRRLVLSAVNLPAVKCSSVCGC